MDNAAAAGQPATAANPAGVPTPPRSGLRLGPAAVFAGAIVGAAITLLFSILGVAVGLYDFDTFTSSEGLGVNDGVWHIVVATIALFVGGWTTSRLAGPASAGTGALRGLVTWVLAAVLGIWVITVLTAGLAVNNARLIGAGQPVAPAAVSPVAPTAEAAAVAAEPVAPDEAATEPARVATPREGRRDATSSATEASPAVATRHFVAGLDHWSWSILIASALAAIIGAAAGRLRAPRAV